MYNILSIDWDYFFPDVAPYDWGHTENRSPMPQQLLWTIRAGNGDMYGKNRPAIDYIKPSGAEKNFWNYIKFKEHSLLAICESHSDLHAIVDKVLVAKKIGVWNFDAHHDLYHKDELDCANWPHHLITDGYIKLKDYHLIMPAWAKEANVMCNSAYRRDRVDVRYDMPEDLPEFDMIFICRSGAWTPPWCDADWIKFIEHWKGTRQWRTKIALQYALEPREFDKDQAMEWAAQQEEAMKRVIGASK